MKEFDLSLEDIEEAEKFGFYTTYNADNKEILHGTQCNRCGEYFESKAIELYCDKCKMERLDKLSE